MSQSPDRTDRAAMSVVRLYPTGGVRKFISDFLTPPVG